MVLADQKDLDSTPNNHVLTEDDYASVLVKKENCELENKRAPLNDPVKKGMTSLKRCMIRHGQI